MKRLITKKDILLIAAIVLAGAALAVISAFGENGESAVIRLDGEIVEEIPLKGEYYETEINNVTVCRDSGEVYVKESSCSDKTCMRAGRLKKSGDCAVCAPNRVSVEIKGEKNTAHAITG